MKPKLLLFAILFLSSFAITLHAQKQRRPKPISEQIPFGKKLPPPAFDNAYQSLSKPADKRWRNIPNVLYDPVTKKPAVKNHEQNNQYVVSQALQTTINQQATAKNEAGFHLLKDINTRTDSYPHNDADNQRPGYALLNNTSYFFASDGPHGNELWRSDGTAAGTYMVKDIIEGEPGCDGFGIVAANGLLFFTATTPQNGEEPWVSDGTAAGTHLLADLTPGPYGSFPNQYVNVNGEVYFAATSDIGSYNGQLWKTDGTEAGTVLVTDLSFESFGIVELTGAYGLAYFVANNYFSTGYQLFRSDGTAGGTYIVKQIGYNYSDVQAPMQLTPYNNQLYFSANDGSGRKLWSTDGTFDGTHLALGDNGILMQQDFTDIFRNVPFRIMNNVMYIAGYTEAEGGGLYKYDASNYDGVVLVKDLTNIPDAPFDNVVDFVVAPDITVVNDILYFKVISNINGYHDELWKSNGTEAGTELVKTIGPGEAGVFSYNFYNGNGTLYFVVNNDPAYGTELWKSDGTEAGTVVLKDIEPGKRSSQPDFITFSNGKLLFNATDDSNGSELWSSNGTEGGTSMLKDINSTYTNGSDAGFMYRGLSALGDAVVFNAFTAQFGGELYTSDGTASGTKLLNDIATGTDWSYPNCFLNKNKYSYFIGDNAIGTALYRTDGTAAGLQRMTAYINRDIYFVYNFNVTDNGLLFYVLGNRFTGGIELWRSNGTDAGSYQLKTDLYYNNYVVTIGNIGFFVAGDFTNGYELWKSDGTMAGTTLVKDINPGVNGSYPYSLFAFKKELYFGAYDGSSFNYSFWKSDGTENGTMKLKDIEPDHFQETFTNPPVQVYAVSNNKLYFPAFDFTNNTGIELWVTNGTVKGTQLVKDIHPTYSSFPHELTDVNGTLYFVANDDIHGSELWTSDGTAKKTKMVKDVALGDYNSSSLYNFCSAGGILYFLNDATYPNSLWSSDGTENNTKVALDATSLGISNIKRLTASGNQLFFGAFSFQYGTELYAGNAGKHVNPPNSPNITTAIAESNTKFNAIIYPNPTNNIAWLQLTGNTKEAGVSITDISGKMIWQSIANNANRVNLPIEKLPAGVYTVRVTSGTDNKILKLVKE